MHYEPQDKLDEPPAKVVKINWILRWFQKHSHRGLTLVSVKVGQETVGGAP